MAVQRYALTAVRAWQRARQQIAHSQAFPDMMAPAVAVGLGAIGLRAILDNGGSGYFLESTVRHLIARRRQHRVAGRRPSAARPIWSIPPIRSTRSCCRWRSRD